MSRMKKSITAICAMACSAALLAAPAYAKAPGSSCPGTDGYKLFRAFSQNICPELDGFLAQLENGSCDFSALLPPFSCPDVAPPESEGPDHELPVPPAEDIPEQDKDDGEHEKEENAGLSAYEAQVVSLVNAERAKAGLSPLTVNGKVTEAARLRCQEQTVSFSHTRPNGARFSSVLDEAGISYLGAGENIAYGQRSAEEVMESWMNSPGHRANILREEYTEIGVGCYQDASGRLYWTQLFIY